MQRKLAISILSMFGAALVLLVACGSPATPPPPVVQTVVVPQTVVSQATVVVPQTVVAQQTVVSQQTVVAPQTVVVPPTASPQEFAGVTVNLLTFTGPQIAEPLQRRAPDFEKLTGAHVNVVTVANSALYQTILTDASTGTNSYDAWVLYPQWLGDFVNAGIMEDLTDRINADKALEWNDISPFFKNFSATYNGKDYLIPLDGDFMMVYYRTDILGKDNVKPPETWDDYLAIAKKYNGQDLNGDGKPDYGSCLFKAPKQQSYWNAFDIAAAYIQSQGTAQGTFFNTDNMQPLTNNDAFKAALEVYKATGQYGPPNELNLGVGDTRGLFTSGQCALAMDWGDIGPLAVDPAQSKVQDKVGAVILPGSKSVLDRATGKLVPCDSKTCPYAVNGVNHAPYAAAGGWSGGINKNSKVKDAAYAFLSYMEQPAQANVDVTIGKTGFNPYRLSQFQNLAPWLASGMSESAARNYLGAIEDSLNSPNLVLDLRIPQNQDYQQVILDGAVSQYLAGQIDVDTAMKQITDAWNAKTDELGRDKQLAAYKASLGITK